MINPECESILGHLMFHRSLIEDKDDAAKQGRLEHYVSMVEGMQEGTYLISHDPFERSVSMAFELVIKNQLNPWEIDLIEFSKMYMQRVRKTEDVNLLVAGKLVYMAWEIFRLQTEDLLVRVDEPEMNENAFDTWDTDAIELYANIDEPGSAITIMQGALELNSATRRGSSQRHVSLLELLDAFEEAKHEADVREEISKYLEKYKPKEFDDKAHRDTLEQDIAATWARIQNLGAGAIPLADLGQGNKEEQIAVFMSILFLSNMEKIVIWQDKPPFGEIFVEIASPLSIASVKDDGTMIDLSEITKSESSNGSTVVK
jgi:segregation and condensation protein A